MSNANYLKNHFLIAMPRLLDPNFHQAVAYIYEHNEDGALGIVINKPLQRISLGDVMRHLKINIENPDVDNFPVVSGGPVAREQGFIIVPTQNYTSHNDQDQLLAENDQVVISSSKNLLESIAQGEMPEYFIISLGYCGWAAGQMEKEITENTWLVAPLNTEILFQLPFEKRWRAAAASIGVDLNKLFHEAGHA